MRKARLYLVMEHMNISNGNFQTETFFNCSLSQYNYQLITEIKLNDSLVPKMSEHMIKPAESANTQSLEKEFRQQL